MSPGGTSIPAARARLAIASTSRPRPSSLTSRITDSPTVDAASRIVPSGRFPAAMRSSGVSMPWLTALRTRWSTGSIIRSMRNLSISVAWPDISSRTRRSLSRARSRTTNGMRRKISADRHEPHAHHAFAQVAELPLDALRLFLQRAPLAGRHELLDAPQRVLEPGARHHQIADQPHQIVEAGQVHANEIRHRRRRVRGTDIPARIGRFAGTRLRRRAARARR